MHNENTRIYTGSILNVRIYIQLLMMLQIQYETKNITNSLQTTISLKTPL